MELELIEGTTDRVNIVTESFKEELLTKNSIFPVVITRAVIAAADKLRLFRKSERNFQPHGHELPIEGLSSLRDVGVVLGNYARDSRRTDAPIANEMSSKISEFLVTHDHQAG